MALEKFDRNMSEQSVWTNVMKQFARNRKALYSFWILFLFMVIALFADFLANEKPLVAKLNGNWYFPVTRSYSDNLGLTKAQAEIVNADWKNLDYDFVIFPPVPYLPNNIDYENLQSVSPFSPQTVKSLRWRHWLGTDELGHDVLAGLVHGTRISLTVGIISMSIAAIIGILLGSLAGYFGDTRMRVSRARIIMNLIGLFTAIFYSFGTRSFVLSDALADSFSSFVIEILFSLFMFISIILFANILAFPLKKISILKAKKIIPLDIIIMRSIEVFISIPSFFLIISVSAIMLKPSIYMVMAIIGLTSWPGIAKYIRAELLRVRSLDYIEAAHALGFSDTRTLFRHAIPNSLSPVLTAIAFGIASAILIESSLSFLNVGVPAETITWGSMLSAARSSPSSWWLAVFPGMAIFVTVSICNLIGEGLSDALDPKRRK